MSISNLNDDDYISLTDMAKAKEGEARGADVIKNWIRTRTALEFIGVGGQMNNSNFKVVEFDHFKMQTGLPSFVLSPSQIIEQTNAIGIYVKSGRYGGTYAHKDIAFEFGSAISAVLSRYAKCCIIRQNRTFSSMSPETIFPSITGCRSY